MHQLVPLLLCTQLRAVLYSLQVLATQFKFYEAQRSGHLTNNDIPWRGDSGLGDVYGTTALHGGYYTDGGGWAAGASLACGVCCRDACALPAPDRLREAGCREACHAVACAELELSRIAHLPLSLMHVITWATVL